ncbi:MAG: hypothetical protein F6K36_25645 [Symploca sp. SIO3C6]|uniref:ABC transporter permease n=1 Tax=Symploca sp. SIO1C4 TaxID=2607765 RepID=A0A6B3NA69_9CYAN|nr:hypothetical protein [Symploca sp. SIO3C6]NER29989.1 hypothetical protein [Symploca sp. SIO1C4]NET06534.1 hypothetical protein [Symploca sp. SIO2B6]
MTDLLTNPIVYNFLNSLGAGEINLITGLVWLTIATVLSVVGGAIGGILLAGKDLGYQLAATIGGLFGPVGVMPAVLLGLVILKLV